MAWLGYNTPDLRERERDGSVDLQIEVRLLGELQIDWKSEPLDLEAWNRPCACLLVVAN